MDSTFVSRIGLFVGLAVRIAAQCRAPNYVFRTTHLRLKDENSAAPVGIWLGMDAPRIATAPPTGPALVLTYRVLGVALASIGIVQLLSDRGSGLAVSLLAMIVIGVAVSFLPEHLLPGTIAIAVAITVVAVAIDDPPFASFIAMIAAVFGSARLGGRREVIAAVCAVLLVNVAVAIREYGSDDADPIYFIIPIVYFGGAFLLGFASRRQAHYIEESALREEALRREQDGLAERAAAAERERLARELHDVISHGVSLMVVQAEAAREVVLTDPERAATAIDAVSDAGRQAISDLRSMLNLLHESEVKRDLGRLLNPVRSAGLEVELNDRANASALPEDIWLTVYRVVQEAATNTLRHAEADELRVDIARENGSVIVEVSDNGRGYGTEPGSGRGIDGMNERVGSLGGTVTAEALESGRGFKVRAEIPLPQTAVLA
jgi:signal transduction histidine kinase